MEINFEPLTSAIEDFYTFCEFVIKVFAVMVNASVTNQIKTRKKYKWNLFYVVG